MDNNERNSPRNPVRDGDTMSGSPTTGTSGAARQLARNKGLAWVSAITLGAGAASVVGTAAIAFTLASPTAATTASAATAATSASQNTDDDESGSTRQAAPLQAAPAPATSNNAPVATSAAS